MLVLGALGILLAMPTVLAVALFAAPKSGVKYFEFSSKFTNFISISVKFRK